MLKNHSFVVFSLLTTGVNFSKFGSWASFIEIALLKVRRSTLHFLPNFFTSKSCEKVGRTARHSTSIFEKSTPGLNPTNKKSEFWKIFWKNQKNFEPSNSFRIVREFFRYIFSAVGWPGFFKKVQNVLKEQSLRDMKKLIFEIW